MKDAGQSNTRLASRIAGNLAAWDLPRRWTAALLAVPLVVVPLGLLAALTEHPVFYALTVEDGPVEWAQVGALLITGVTSAIIAGRAWTAGARSATALAAMSAVAALVIAGEEISWGQRLLGLVTPAALEAINEQGETTIHNIGAFSTASNLVQFGAAGYGAVLPLLALLPSVPARIRDAYVVPPIALWSFFLGPFLYWAARIPVEPWRAVRRASEITEMSFYAGLALFALFSLRRLQAQRDLGRRASPDDKRRLKQEG